MTGAEVEVNRKKLDSIREAAVLVYSVITWEQVGNFRKISLKGKRN